MRNLMIVSLIVAGAISCRDSGTQSDRTFSIGTAAVSYVVSEPIAVILANRSNRVINVATCCMTNPDLRLQHEVDADWTPPGSCELRCASYPLLIGLEDQLIDTIAVSQPGRYRLMLRFGRGSVSAMDDSVFSNEFDVR